MQCTVKTSEEIRQSRVTLELTGDRDEIAQVVAAFTATAGDSAESTDQAERIRELEGDLSRVQQVSDNRKRLLNKHHEPGGVYDRLQQRAEEVTQLRSDLAAAQQAREIETKRAHEAEHLLDGAKGEAQVQRNRANDNRRWAETAEDHLKKQTTKLEQATEKLALVRRELVASGVKDAQEEVTTPVSKRLSAAIREAVNLIDQA